MKRFLMIMVAVAAMVGLGIPTAHAAPPTIERIDIDEEFPDEFLTAACGFPVTVAERGHIIIRTFTDRDKGVVEVLTINLAVTASANGNEYRFRNVGADVTRVTPDGTVILSIIGQSPFGFTGVLKVNLDTGEVIHEPQHSTAEDLEEACAILAA
jgi:hypothetical protein